MTSATVILFLRSRYQVQGQVTLSRDRNSTRVESNRQHWTASSGPRSVGRQSRFRTSQMRLHFRCGWARDEASRRVIMHDATRLPVSVSAELRVSLHIDSSTEGYCGAPFSCEPASTGTGPVGSCWALSRVCSCEPASTGTGPVGSLLGAKSHLQP